MATHTHIKEKKSPARDVFEKIVVNAGVGKKSAEAQFEQKALVQILRDLGLMTGQKPQIRRSKKSIAGFKMREGQVVGLKVTLRRDKMVDFWTRLITMVLPRVKDFNGIDPEDVDHGGTLNIGLKEQFVFPEINPEESLTVFSLGINAVPKHHNREEAMKAYTALGVPFKKEEKKITRK
jgi:large subunit ribosomal protein L5